MRFAPVLLVPVLVLAAVAGCSSGSKLAASSPPAAPTAPAPPPAERRPARLADVPVTHLGRTVLSRTDVIVRGRVVQVTSAAHGAEIGRVAADQWLRGEPREDGETLLVLSAARGALPALGRDALLLLGARTASDNFEFVESIELTDADGGARLDAFRQVLRIEAADDPAERVALLRAYLERAISAESKWTRWNAAREYAALAAELPAALSPADRPVLEKALATSRDPGWTALLEPALGACPGGERRVIPTAAAGPRESRPSVLDEPAARFSAAGATAADRRAAIVDAAVAAGAASAPLLERGLADPDPAVREAAAAAAGQLGVVALEPKIASMLVNDESPLVRRTLVAAAGHLRSESSVPTLALLAKGTGPLGEDAAFALARIRSDAALSELRRLRAAATEAERASLLEFLLSDRFAAQEKALGEKRPR